MKYSNRKLNIKIVIFLIGILIFVGGTLFDFYCRIQHRIYQSQLEIDAKFLFGNDLHLLFFKIIIAVILLCGIIVHYANKEKKYYMQEIDEKKKSEEELKEKADRDYLTGLFNRRSGEEQVGNFLKQIENSKVCHAFIIMDLDNFKSLNDTFGHQIGDLALKEVADVLYRHFHAEDIIYRLGGDEFAVLMKNVPVHIIEKNIKVLLEKILKIYEREDKAVTLSASVGIALWPVHGKELKELYEKADHALYHVKEKGKASFEIYQEHQKGDI